MRRLPIVLGLLVASFALATAAPAGTTTLGGRPLALVATPEGIWALTCDRGCSGEGRQSVGQILRVDPGTGRVVARTQIAVPGRIAVGAGGVYAPDIWGGTLRRFDARTLRLTATLPLTLPRGTPAHGDGFLPSDVAVGAADVWVSTEWCTLARTDAAAHRTVARVPLPCDAYGAMVAHGRDVWVSESLAGLYRIDAAGTRVVARIQIGPASRRLDVSRLLVIGNRVAALGAWSRSGTLSGQNALALIDLRHNRVERTVSLPRGALTATSDGRRLLVARLGGSSIERIDPASGAITGRIRARVGVSLVASRGRLFTAFANGALVRVGP
jgi:hypothetical protein